MMKKFVSLSMMAVMTAGCAIRKDLKTPFSPTEMNTVSDGGEQSSSSGGTKYCSPDASGAFASNSNIVTSGQLPAEGAAWAEGGGCIARPLREVWGALQNIDQVKFEAADSLKYTRTVNPSAQFTHLYEVTYFKSTIIGMIDWTIQWYHGLLKGTMEKPQKVRVVYARTQGTSNIPLWRGSILLSKVNDQITSIAIRNEFKARQSSGENEESAKAALVELIEKSRTVSPDYDHLDSGVVAPSLPDTGDDGGNSDHDSGGGNATSYCVKDASGNYPTVPKLEAATEGVQSRVTGTVCLPQSVAQVLNTLKDHKRIHWKDTSDATFTTEDASPGSAAHQPFLIDHVVYSVNHYLWHTQVKMLWDYQLTGGSLDAPEGIQADYKLEAPSKDYPAWTGEILVSRVEDGMTSVQVQNDLLTDTVSSSAKSNAAMVQQLLTTLH